MSDKVSYSFYNDGLIHMGTLNGSVIYLNCWDRLAVYQSQAMKTIAVFRLKSLKPVTEKKKCPKCGSSNTHEQIDGFTVDGLYLKCKDCNHTKEIF